MGIITFYVYYFSVEKLFMFIKEYHYLLKVFKFFSNLAYLSIPFQKRNTTDYNINMCQFYKNQIK